MNFKADLSAASGVDSKGTGAMTGSLDTDTHMFSYDITYSGLTGPPIAAHFHGPAAPGANAKPEFAIKSLESPIKGMQTLTPAQEKDLEGGMLYVNVHTAANKGGEIRGQVVPAM
jgi:hypothetical protein